jgi:BlaI family penicillinase repressor
VKKGVLRFRSEGNRYLYYPAIPRQHYVREESASFIDRVFGGETTPALMHFARNTRLTKDEIEELRRILDEKGEEK